MAAGRQPLTGVVLAGSGVTLLARVRSGTGDLITQAALTSIGWTLSDLTNGLALTTGTFVVVSTVFNALQQNDQRWTQDSARNLGSDGVYGYNFAATLGAANFPVSLPASVLAASTLLPTPPSVRYRADVLFTPVSGEVFRVAWEWTPLKVFG